MDAATLANLWAWSLQALALVVIGGPLPYLLRLHDPSARHTYWRALLLACLLLPLLQPWQAPTLPAPVGGGDLELLTGGSGAAGVGTGITTTVVGSLRTGRWATAISLLLAAGILARLAWLVAGLLRLRRLRRASARAGVEQVPEAVTAACACRYADGLSQPVTFGVRRPVVLLPPALAAQPPALRRAVIEHELWHVRRRDWIWVVVEECVRALLWFHPAITWLVSQVQASREEVVDELTVLSTNARRDYLEALLAFADEPPLFPAAPFARRRHLFRRMLLISREVVMSPKRILGTCAAMAAVVVASAAWTTAAFPLRADTAPATSQTRDFRPGEARPASQEEIALRAAVTKQPTIEGYLRLAELQQERNAGSEAEATLTEARVTLSNNTQALLALVGLYQEQGRSDRAFEVLEQVAASAPTDPKTQNLVGSFYEEAVRKTPNLDPAVRGRYIAAGLAAEDRALTISPDYPDALVIKNILLRHEARYTSDPGRQAQLIAEADQLRNQALELRKAQSGGVMMKMRTPAPGMPPPPPPPPPPGGELEMKMRRGSAFDGTTVDGVTPLRVGGNIKPPTKIRHVNPVYPAEALESKIQGVVILETLIDGGGMVQDVKVLRSIPLLDEAAAQAVRQWQFTPTLLNGNPVPVIMTVTVNFTLQ